MILFYSKIVEIIAYMVGFDLLYNEMKIVL